MTRRPHPFIAAFIGLCACAFGTSCAKPGVERRTEPAPSVLSIIGTSPSVRAATGETVPRVVSIRNGGSRTEENLEVRVTVPPAGSAGLTVITSDACKKQHDELRCPLKAIASGATIDVGFALSVDPDATCGPHSFTAELCRSDDPAFSCIANDAGTVVVSCTASSASSSSSLSSASSKAASSHRSSRRAKKE